MMLTGKVSMHVRARGKKDNDGVDIGQNSEEDKRKWGLILINLSAL